MPDAASAALRRAGPPSPPPTRWRVTLERPQRPEHVDVVAASAIAAMRAALAQRWPGVELDAGERVIVDCLGTDASR